MQITFALNNPTERKTITYFVISVFDQNFLQIFSLKNNQAIVSDKVKYLRNNFP